MAQVHYDPGGRAWTLRSGPLEYRLAQHDQAVTLDYFGPSGAPAWKEPSGTAYDIAGIVDGHRILPQDLMLASHQVRQTAEDVHELRLVFKHRTLPLQIDARYAAWGATGVLTRQLTLANIGSRVLPVESFPSLAWSLPRGPDELTYLYGGWGRERQVAAEKLGAGRRAFVSSRGRSSNGYSPWFSLCNEQLGVRYAAQLAYSGNWEMSFERLPGRRPLDEEMLTVELGMRFDSGQALALPPGQSLLLPQAAFTASAGDLDAAANQLHRYQRTYVIPRIRANDPLLVQFNSWYPSPGKMTVEQMRRCADIAAEVGAEVFVLDAGWFNKRNWSRELGDWEADPVAFPNGIQELARQVRARTMKFGIWVEIENLGLDSKTFALHPDWCLTYQGLPLRNSSRCHLNFAKPEVRRWARSIVDRLIRDFQIEWLKIDYNIDIGEQFDPPGADRSRDVLYRHLMSYYAWLDEVRAAHPGLVIENCSSGGLRFDLGIMAHAHTTWLSDEVRPLPSLQLAYGCTLEFPAEICNHWMVGDNSNGEVTPSGLPGWWDFMLRVPMNGQFGISSRVFDWSASLKKRAAENVALYKRLRNVIAGADVYHLTPPPSHDAPTGWMALQYAAPDRKRGVVMAYRLAASHAQGTFRLRGLAPERLYQVRQDGRPRGVFTGLVLSQTGLTMKLDSPWRATVIELEAEP